MTVDEVIRTLKQMKKENIINGETLCLVFDTTCAQIYTEDLSTLIPKEDGALLIFSS